MKKLVILLAAALTFNSCSDSFLDLSNPSALSPSVYPKSMADMETIVTSVYANMVAVPLYGKRVMAKGTFCVDHTVDMAWTGDANWNQLATNQVTSDNAYIGTLWIGYYKMISCANTVLEQLERIDKEKFTVVCSIYKSLMAAGEYVSIICNAADCVTHEPVVIENGTDIDIVLESMARIDTASTIKTAALQEKQSGEKYFINLSTYSAFS